MKKIIVSGSTGFIGRHLVPKLIEEGYQVLEITRSKIKSQNLYNNETSKLEVHDENFNNKVINFKPQIVIHLASYLTASDEWDDIEKLIDVNITFLSKILNAVSKINLELFINTGTFAEYFKGDDVFIPSYYYAATKTAARSILDYYTNTYNFKQVTVVPYTIYGGEDTQKKIIDIIYDSTKSEHPVDLSPGEQILDFIHIRDVIEFYIIVLNNYQKLSDKNNFNLGTGVGNSLRDLGNKIEKYSKSKVNINWGGKKYRKSDVMYAVADIARIKKIFFWEPKITLDKGLQILIKEKRDKILQ